MIRHAALFRLRHDTGSPEELRFLAAIRELKTIPGVERFELARETSPKNDFDFAVSMYFRGCGGLPKLQCASLACGLCGGAMGSGGGKLHGT